MLSAMSNYKNITDGFIILRQKHKVSRAEMAEYLSISESMYRKLENGESPIGLDRVIKVCEYFDVDLRDYLDQVLDSKRKCEYEAIIHRHEVVVDQLKLELSNVWSLNFQFTNWINPEMSALAEKMRSNLEEPKLEN